MRIVFISLSFFIFINFCVYNFKVHTSGEPLDRKEYIGYGLMSIGCILLLGVFENWII